MVENSNENKDLKSGLFIITDQISSHLLRMSVQVAPWVVKIVYLQTLESYKRHSNLSGFKKKTVPLGYLEENYAKEIKSNLKNFLFKHIVLDFLMEQIRNQKIPLTNYPRLADIKTIDNKKIIFIFDLSVADPIELKEWKHFVFRSPKRKRYKDLDKQVTLFIKREATLFKRRKLDIVEENDWVCFDAMLINNKKSCLLDQYKSNFWIKVNNKYITKPFHAVLLEKKVNDFFVTEKLTLKNDFSEELEHDKYLFLIKIKEITKGQHLSLESFKANFKLKSKLDVHKKLIEVFSYRNDISQRKMIIEELFHLFLSKHRFEVPKHFVIRRQEDILHSLKQHPDYQVYKLQKDFENQVETLAEKQLKEEILIDQISYNENLKVDNKDVQNYLYLFNNNRLKEFVYFKPLLEKIEDTDVPIQSGLLKQATLREKTLNHVIHVLTK